MEKEVTPVLIPLIEIPASLDRHLPLASANLFQRIIRDPRPDSPHARERECAEMLCAVLQCAPLLRRRLFQTLAELVSMPSRLLDGLRFDFTTEKRVGNLRKQAENTEDRVGDKRIDLLIEGRIDRQEDEHQGKPPVVVWAIEVKVGAGIHQSSPICDGDPKEDDEGASEDESVSQIVNYDGWLRNQSCKHRQGFVLALHDMQAHLPPSVKDRWKCFTWTQLGEQVEAALADHVLPVNEQLLARHFAGFIRDNLWRSSAMSEPTIDFNDVALIRAFSKMGRDCLRKADDLMECIKPILQDSGLGVGKVSHDQHLFKSGTRSVVARHLTKGQRNDRCPRLVAGIGAWDGNDYLKVCIETPPSHPNKRAIVTAVAAALPKLKRRDGRWDSDNDDQAGDDMSVVDVDITVPLSRLLEASDQEQMVIEFVQSAIADLKAVGLVKEIQKVMQSSSNRQARR